jgi:flagellin-like protein
MRCSLILFRILKSKKGISPILATLLLIVIAVAAIIVTYAWVMTYVGTQTVAAGVLITSENVRWYGLSDGVLNVSAHNRIDINVRNIGTSTVKIVRVYMGISQSNLMQITAYCVAGINATFQPQQIETITIQWPISGIGNMYTVGTTYYFNIATEPGTSYAFPSTPTGV